MMVFNPEAFYPAQVFSRLLREIGEVIQLGLVLEYDFCRWIGIFTEYDYYDYGRFNSQYFGYYY